MLETAAAATFGGSAAHTTLQCALQHTTSQSALQHDAMRGQPPKSGFCQEIKTMQNVEAEKTNG